jgi:hypothetical protein
MYRIIILPVVLYGYSTWSFTLKEGHLLLVFENRVLRKVFGSTLDEVTGKWRKLHSEVLHSLYSSPNVIRAIKYRRMKWAGMWLVWGKGDVHTGFGEEPEYGAAWKTYAQIG